MTDINTVIAAFKGWKQIDTKDEDGTKGKLWVNDSKDIPWWEHGKLPDFEHDARLYMALFEEMAKTKSDIHEDRLIYVDLLGIKGNLFHCYLSHGCMCHESVFESDTIGTAICLAFCKLKGIEVVG